MEILAHFRTLQMEEPFPVSPSAFFDLKLKRENFCIRPANLTESIAPDENHLFASRSYRQVIR